MPLQEGQKATSDDTHLAIQTLDDLRRSFQESKYVSDSQIEMAVYLALKLQKPLLVEGEPGCGKTEIAKVISAGLGTRLIRLQCYEGLDANSTIYEWDYLRQIISIRMEENRKTPAELEKSIFSEKFLLKRPLLEAILYDGERPPVLLIDEIDRADEEFEGLLLELLAEFQVTIPEIGTFKAKRKPVIVITSNRTRELGDGLRRRCLYLYITYPSLDKELQIVKLKVPGIEDRLARQIVQTVTRIRLERDIIRKPGTSETLDWANALVSLGKSELTPEIARETLSCVLKSSDELLLLSPEKMDSILKDVLN